MCILLAEDEPLIRELAHEVLTDAGHEVVVAAHGQEACDWIDRSAGRLSCLVTDYLMPGGVTGRHVIEHARATYPLIPVLLTTGFASDFADDWRTVHHVRLVIKPYSIYDLAELVEQLVQDQSL